MSQETYENTRRRGAPRVAAIATLLVFAQGLIVFAPQSRRLIRGLSSLSWPELHPKPSKHDSPSFRAFILHCQESIPIDAEVWMDIDDVPFLEYSPATLNYYLYPRPMMVFRGASAVPKFGFREIYLIRWESGALALHLIKKKPKQEPR